MRYINDVTLSGKIVDIEEVSYGVQSYFILQMSDDEFIRIMCCDDLSSALIDTISANTNVVVSGNLLCCSTSDSDERYALVCADTIITEAGEVYTIKEDIDNILKRILRL